MKGQNRAVLLRGFWAGLDGSLFCRFSRQKIRPPTDPASLNAGPIAGLL